MQWGVIEDFAESCGYYIRIIYNKLRFWDMEIVYNNIGVEGNETFFYAKIINSIETRNEARLDCIKQLNEILNN